MKGHFPKAYLRMDPNLDQHPDFDGMVLLMCAANRQPDRGRFEPSVVKRLLGKKRTLAFMTVRPGKRRPDLVELEDGRLYLDGWDEWQEGDFTVGERVRRLRAKRSGIVSSPLPDRNPPPEALGVGRRASGERQESTNAAASRAGGGRSNGSPPAPPASGGGGWVLDHDPGNPVEVRLASRIAHLSSLVAERDGADGEHIEVALEVLAAVSTTESGAHLDHIRGAPDKWLEPTLRACDKFEADNFGGDEPPSEGRA